MKKRIVSVMLCMLLACSMTACGNSNTAESTDTSSVSGTSGEAETSGTESEATTEIPEEIDGVPVIDKEDYEISECIKLGEYKGLELTKTVEPVTDADVRNAIIQLTGDTGKELTDPDATIQNGDTATIMYVGKKDGVAFEGGTNEEPYDLQIGSGSFIDGFEEGLIGMKAGETRELNLTFPENYASSELAGQDVVFTVTVNAIKRLIIDDEWVKENADTTKYANAEEYLADNRKTLEEQNELSAENNLKSECWNKIISDATYLAYPKHLIVNAQNEYEESIVSTAEEYGYTLDAYLEACGVDKTYFNDLKSEYGVELTQETLVQEALLKAENLSKDSQEYNDALNELVEDCGAESAEELIEAYGEERIESVILSTIAVERVLSYAKITEA